MIDAIDIFRAAKLVIDRHGEEAALYAAARRAVLAGAVDLEGTAVCIRSPLRSKNCRERRLASAHIIFPPNTSDPRQTW